MVSSTMAENAAVYGTQYAGVAQLVEQLIRNQ